MKKILKFCHKPGRHCASTSIRDLMEFHGIFLSESMCFGIGEGLGIWYLKDIPDAPTILFHVRSHDLESSFFNNICIPFEWQTYELPQESTDALIKNIDSNRPVLTQTDIYHLPYFNSSTHFPGHAIVVWGYDRDQKNFFVSDTEHKESLKVSFRDMEKAMFFDGFFKGKGNQFAPKTIEIPSDMDEVLKKAIYHNSLKILENKSNEGGINALDMWIEEYKKWAEFSDWRWCARFTYQIIEKRGTGGGGFRLMYSEFLKEASVYLPVLKKKGLPQLMNKIGETWRDLAYTLKHISEQPTPSFEELRPICLRLRELEYKYHTEIVETL